MKIALLVQNADRRAGGAEGYTLDLARSLTLRGYSVTVVAESGPAAVAEGALAAGFKCIFLGSAGRTRWRRLQDFLHRLRDLYASHAYDIVHAMLPVWRCDVYQPHSGLANDLLQTGHLKHPNGIVQFWSHFCNQFNPKRRGLARIEEAMLRHDETRLLCFSSMMRTFAREHFGLPEERMITVVNGIDLARFDPGIRERSRAAIRGEWRIDDTRRLGLLVGNNWKLKGVTDALAALARLKSPRISLMVVGRDDPAPYRAMAAKLGIADRVIFPGSVSDPRPLYGAADFVLLPTRRDTCSLVVLEALAMGLPVITTRQNGASEVIEQGRQGLLLERNDPAALAGAIEQMLDAELLGRMAREALALRESLSIDHHVSRIESVYQSIISARIPTATP